MPKRLILASIVTFLIAASMQSARATECWARSEKETIPVPAGVTLQPGGYICVDHLGTYAEAAGAGEREVMLRARPLPRSDLVRPHIQPRPLARMGDLLNAGLAYPEQPAAPVIATNNEMKRVLP